MSLDPLASVDIADGIVAADVATNPFPSSYGNGVNVFGTAFFLPRALLNYWGRNAAAYRSICDWSTGLRFHPKTTVPDTRCVTLCTLDVICATTICVSSAG